MILEISFHARTSRLILVELGPSILCSGKQFCPCMGLFFTSSYLLYVDKIIRWRNRSERSPCMQKVGCSNPSRDRPKALKTWQQRSAAMPVSRSFGDHYKRMSRVTAGKPSLLYGHECRVQVKICSPSLAMVASPYK